MNKLIQAISIFIFVLTASTSKSQVLISLLFGEQLNSPKVEFGLVGGVNQSYISDIEDSKGLNNFNIGFYFHFLLKKNSYLSTGVLVKTNVGATGMKTYPIDNAEFDSLYSEGTLTKKINYFYVPIMFHQRFGDNRWYAEGGFQVGLRNNAFDIFKANNLGGEMEYKLETKDQYKHLDAGLLAGFGYKFKKEIKSMALGVNYYYGLVDVSLTNQKIVNSSLYVYMKIPIGAAGKKEK